jgi:hypothetical protein
MTQRVKILLSCLAFIASTTQLWAATAPGLGSLVVTATKLKAGEQYRKKINEQTPTSTPSGSFGSPAAVNGNFGQPPAAAHNNFGPNNTAGSGAPSQEQQDSAASDDDN